MKQEITFHLDQDYRVTYKSLFKNII